MNRRTNRLRRCAALVLTVILLACMYAGCAKGRPDGAPPAGTTENGGGSTNGSSASVVFRGEPLSFSGEQTLLTFQGYGTVDPETGAVTALGILKESSSDGGGQPANRYALLFLTENGASDSLPLPVETEGNAVVLPVIAPDSGTGSRYVYYAEQRFLSADYTLRETVLCRLDRDSGAVLRSAPVDGLFPQNTRQFLPPLHQ